MTLAVGESFAALEIVGTAVASGGAEIHHAKESAGGAHRRLELFTGPSRELVVSDMEFSRNLGIFRQLQHPHLLPLIRGGVAEGQPYRVWAWVPGDSLRARCQPGPLPLTRAFPLFTAIARGLEHLHAREILHRNLTPDSVWVGEGGEVLLADFGLGQRDSQAVRTRMTQVPGLVRYLSPEEVQVQHLDPASDLYALGLVIHETLTGQLPYAGSNLPDWVMRITRQEPPPLSSKLPGFLEEMDHLVKDMLAKDPALRPSTGEVRQQLEVLQARLGLHHRIFVAPPEIVPEDDLPPEPPAAPRAPTAPAAGSSSSGEISLDSLPVAPRRTSTQVRRTTSMRIVAPPPPPGPSPALIAGGVTGVTLLLLVAGVLLFRSGRATPAEITIGPGGRVELTMGRGPAGEGTLTALPSSGQGVEARLVEGAGWPAVLEGLNPGQKYELRYRGPAGNLEREIQIPIEEVEAKRDFSLDRFRMKVSGVPVVGGLLDLKGPAGALHVPGYLSLKEGTSLIFEMTLPADADWNRVLLDIHEPGGMVRRQELPPIRGAALQLDGALASAEVDSLLAKVVNTPEWPKPGAESPHGRVRDLLLDAVEKEGWMPLFKQLAPSGPAFFGEEGGPLELRRRLHQHLQEVAWLDRLARSRGDPPPLDVASLHETFVNQETRLGGVIPGKGTAVLPAPTAWIPPKMTAPPLRDVHWIVPRLREFLGEDGTGSPIARSHRDVTEVPWSKAAGKETASLHAVVSMMPPHLSLWVGFRTIGSEEEPIWLSLDPPGSATWRTAMTPPPPPEVEQDPDEVAPEDLENLELLERPKKVKGKRTPGPSLVPVPDPPRGEIIVRFPAALLPPGPLEVRLDARTPPGLTSDQLQRGMDLMVLWSLTLDPGR